MENTYSSRALYLKLALALVWALGIGYLWPMNAIPGLGLSALLFLTLALCLFARGRKKLSGGERFVLVSVILLCAWYALFSNEVLRLLNLPAVFFLMSLLLFSVNDGLSSPVMSKESVARTLRLAPKAVFCDMDAPFHALKKIRGAKGIAGGVILSALVLLPVLLLLSSADEVFAGKIAGMLNVFSDIASDRWVMRTLLALFVFFAAASYMEATGSRKSETFFQKEKRERPSVTFALPLIGLNIVYAFFIGIQFVYLFGGAEAAHMTGGYAQYARKGFFELSAVCAVNLLAVHISLASSGYKKSLRILTVITCLSTGVMLVSAAMRMMLYISVFALSFLRLFTLWAMLVMALFTLFTAMKAVQPAKKLFPRTFAIALCAYLAFCYINADALIAWVNLSAFKSGRIETCDREYLSGLSADALIALSQFSDESEDARCALGAISRRSEHVHPFEWSLTHIFSKKNAPVTPDAQRP